MLKYLKSIIYVYINNQINKNNSVKIGLFVNFVINWCL